MAQKAKFGSFQDLVEQSDLVLVDFYATWCGPCHMMAQIMTEASTSMKHVKFAKVDTEKYASLASQYQVAALPTLVLFRGGRPIGRLEGVVNAADLRRWVEQTAQRAPQGAAV